jgi:hypothetical protein
MDSKTKTTPDVSVDEAVAFLVEQGLSRGAAVVIVRDQLGDGGRIATRFLLELAGARMLGHRAGTPLIVRF